MPTTTLLVLGALTLSLLLIPLAERAAHRTGILAYPRSRDMHSRPVPLLGGAAIYLGAVIALLLFGDRAFVPEFLAILSGASLASLFGLIDDRYRLPAWLKLLGQLAAAVLTVAAGTRIQLFPLDWVNWLIAVFWILAVTNAFNLIDNMDGLSAGVAAIGAAFFVVLAAMNEPRQLLVGAMAAALIGACLGFLRYNLNPATIFMGDAGSLFLGFMMAALAIKLRFPANTALVTWMVPVCVLALPLFDTTLVVISRLRRGLNPLTTPGRDHLSHRLHALGLTRREAVLVCYLLSGAGGLIGVYITQARPVEAYAALAVLVIALGTALIWLERVCPRGMVDSPAAAD
jgi:UDP-GlcNAc:undecaprenyl-phosphate GlcNAc-1-phosphate transferase